MPVVGPPAQTTILLATATQCCSFCGVRSGQVLATLGILYLRRCHAGFPTSRAHRTVCPTNAWCSDRII